MRVGFVVQRYGKEVNGGAETLCRSVAERLNRFVSIEVLTTTAVDHHTWAQHYPTGKTELNGIAVHRFPVTRRRKPHAFQRLSEHVLHYPHTILDEVAWMEAQGPETPALIDHLREHRREYDTLVFFTYLYYTTYFGLQIAPEKSILVPTAHDEAPIHLAIFRPIFRSPKAILYLTDAEKRFVQSLFHVEHIPSAVTGIGIESPHAANGARFRRKYGIEGPFMLYAGRIEISKNCDELFDYYLSYGRAHGFEVSLVLLGREGMEIPDNPGILALGFVNEQDKFDALQAADLLVLPSRFESLSIASLEAWRVGTPVLANGRSEVLKEHCLRSNGGLFYFSYEEFAAAVQLLMNRPGLRASLGAAGQRYVADQYGWERIEAGYLSVLRLVTSGVRPETN